MYSQAQTRQLVKAFYEGACAQKNVSDIACLINVNGDIAFMTELFTVRGFKDLLAAALPPEQHNIGHLALTK